MKEMCVFMPITGKTTGENPPYSLTLKKCARTGPQRSSLAHIRKVAPWNTDANSAMGGKNKNFILSFSKLSPASMAILVKNLIVHTTMENLTVNTLCLNGSSTLQRLG